MATLLNWFSAAQDSVTSLIAQNDENLLVGLGEGWNADVSQEAVQAKLMWESQALLNEGHNVESCRLFHLPEELQVWILSKLPARDLITTGCASRALRRLVKDEALWKLLFHNSMGGWKAFTGGGSSSRVLGKFSGGLKNSVLRELGGWLEKKLAELEEAEEESGEDEVCSSSKYLIQYQLNNYLGRVSNGPCVGSAEAYVEGTIHSTIVRKQENAYCGSFARQQINSQP